MMNGFFQRSRILATVSHESEVGCWLRIQCALSNMPRLSLGTNSMTFLNSGSPPCASTVVANQRR